MGLGERCDEIVRLIDETLAALAADPADTLANPSAPAATVTSFPLRGTHPDRAASGF